MAKIDTLSVNKVESNCHSCYIADWGESIILYNEFGEAMAVYPHFMTKQLLFYNISHRIVYVSGYVFKNGHRSLFVNKKINSYTKYL